MKVRRLKIDRLPGIDMPFEVEFKGDGFHVIHGPNAIGKSSICRGFEALLWVEHGPRRRVSLTGEFELNGELWSVEREDEQIVWRHNGQDGPPPFIPSPDLRNSYFLKLNELIDLSKDGTQDIATAIRKEMAGGVDLAQIIEENFGGIGARPGATEVKELNDKNNKIRKAVRGQEQLQKEADNLEAYQAELKEAEDSQAYRDNVNLATELAECRNNLEIANQTLGSFPSCLSKLNESESEDVRSASGEIEILKDRLSRNEDSLADAGNKREASGLNAPIDQSDLDAWNTKETNLRNAKQDRDNKREAHARDHAKLEEAMSAVGKVDHDLKFDLASHHEIFDFLRKAQDQTNHIDAVDARIQLLESVHLSKESHPIIEHASDGVEALRKWLRAGGTVGPRNNRWFWLSIFIVMTLVGAVLAWFTDPWFAGLGGLGVGLAVTFDFRRGGQTASNGRGQAQADFENLSLDGPSDWNGAAVELRLRDLERQIAVREAEDIRARDREVELQNLKNDRQLLNQGVEEIEAERQDLIGKLKLEDIPPDADLVDRAIALDQLRQASLQEGGVAKQLSDSEKIYADLLADLADAIENAGEARPSDLDMVAATLKNIGRRNAVFIQSEIDVTNATTTIEETNKDLKKYRDQIHEIYKRADLEAGDLVGLDKLMTERPAYKDQVDQANALKVLYEDGLKNLDQAGQVDLVDMSLEDLGQKSENLSKLVDTIPDLHKEIAEINAEIKRVRSGNDIETLILEKDELLSRLQDRRDEVLWAEAGKLLLATVEQEHETTQMPRVLADANKHFSDFTHHNYSIELDKGGVQPRLVAINQTTGKRQSINELSDGTRAQLLLSARVAFAKESERGAAFPLFLDEALDQSDPARTQAIVQSLGRVSRDQDRQIFYFTSDPSDLGAIQQALDKENCEKASEIDLGAIRSEIEAIANPSSLYVAPRKSFPEPGDSSAEDYGLTIQATPFDPVRQHASQHLIHLLWDHLDFLHELLINGIVSVGQWQGIADSEFIQKAASNAIEPDQIGYRADLLQVFCKLWQQGRGKPVGRNVLMESNAVTERFLGGLSEVADQLGGDGVSLIKVMKDKTDERTAGFRTNNIDDLEQYFFDEGYIDEDPVLTEDQLLPLALAAPVAAKLHTTVASECLHRWWELGLRIVESANGHELPS